MGRSDADDDEDRVGLPVGRPEPEGIAARLADWRGRVVVIDCTHPYVAIGRLTEATADYVELADADMHDLRDSTTSREIYLVKTVQHGVGANRRRLLFRMEHIVGISPLDEVIAE